MKILLFGANGMLGHYVYLVLSKNYTVIPLTRNVCDIEKSNEDDIFKLIYSYYMSDTNLVIVNCAGIVPQRTQPDQFRKYLKVNTSFPRYLAKIVDKLAIRMIHITTDCIFDGTYGSYDELSLCSEHSIYGTSKSLGEPENVCVIRTSIIGEELHNKKSLLEWVKSNKDKQIYGYINHRWNGVTCLTLAEIINQIINHNLYWTGVRHFFSPQSISKYELCQIISDVYHLNIDVQPAVTIKKCDRTLSSIWNIPHFIIGDLKTQIINQSRFNI